MLTLDNYYYISHFLNKKDILSLSSKDVHNRLSFIVECKTNAMDCAVRNGQLEIVIWFYNNTHGEWTLDLLTVATLNGHLEVVKWLKDNIFNKKIK